MDDPGKHDTQRETTGNAGFHKVDYPETHHPIKKIALRESLPSM